MQTSVHTPAAPTALARPVASPRKRTPLDMGSLVLPHPAWLQVKPEERRIPLTDGEVAEAQMLVDVVGSGIASKQTMARLAELDRIAFINGQSLTDALSAASKKAHAEKETWRAMSPDARRRKAIAVLLAIAGDHERIQPFSVEWEALVHARAELVNLVAETGVAQ